MHVYEKEVCREEARRDFRCHFCPRVSSGWSVNTSEELHVSQALSTTPTDVPTIGGQQDTVQGGRVGLSLDLLV